MMSQIKSHRKWLEPVAWIVALVIALWLVGCGSGDSQTDSKIIVKNPQRTRPAATPLPAPPPPVVDTVTVPDAPVADVASAPEPAKVVTFEEAEAAFQAGRYAHAAELFTHYTERKSENPWGYYMLGLSAWKAGDREIAQGAFARALELDPKHVKSHLNLARVLLDSGQPDSALVSIRQALELDPGSSVAYRLKGRVFDAIHQLPQAVESYNRALELDPNDAWSMNNLALIFIEEGLYDEALPPLARAVEIQTDNATFWNNLGMALEHCGQYRAAEDAYRTAVASNADFEKAAVNLSRVETVLEDPGLEPIDLAAIARRFAEELDSSSVVVDESDGGAETEVASGENEESEVADETADDPEKIDSNDGEQHE